MLVTEQRDAMGTLRTDPYRYLVAPRVLASTIALPLLVLVANSIGIFGGWLLATDKLGFNSATYLSVPREFLEMDDLVMSLVKAGVFGCAVGLLGCYNGFTSHGGAAGVGRETTIEVGEALGLVLLSNLLCT